MNPENDSERSDLSDLAGHAPKLIPKHGGYRRLRSFRVALVVYDGTRIFCDRFIQKTSRTHDQMVQAARSGVRNIAEGSMASATSKKPNSSLQGWPAPVSKNSWGISRITSARTPFASGPKILLRPAQCAKLTGQPFWGCSAYPDCTGTRPIAAAGG